MTVSRGGSRSSDDDLVAAALTVLNVDPGASMAQIATAAGVGRATIHRHFATREDLIAEIGQRAIDRWEASLRASGALEPKDSADEHLGALRDLVGRYVQDAEDFGFALTNPEIEDLRDFRVRCLELVDRETRVFADAQRAGALRDDVPAEWIGHVLFGLLRSGIDARRYESVAPRRIPDLVAGSFFAAVGR